MGYSLRGRKESVIDSCDFCIALWNCLDFPGGSGSKQSACDAGNQDRSLGWEEPLEKGMATLFSIFIWRIP